MAIIRQLKNFFTKQVIYPKTLTKAVYDENGERLDKILRDTMLATDSEEYNGVEPRDADTLGGKYKANDISAIEDKITGLNNSLNSINSNLDNSLMKNKEYSTCFTTTKVYGNYAAPLFINTIEMPTIKSVVVYNDYNGTDILNEVKIDDYHSNNFTLKCSNDICAGSVVVVTFN